MKLAEMLCRRVHKHAPHSGKQIPKSHTGVHGDDGIDDLTVSSSNGHGQENLNGHGSNGHHENDGGFFQRFYAWSLRKALKYHRVTSAISAAVLIATIVLFGIVPKGFIPNDDLNQLLITTEAIQGISYEDMSKLQAKIADIVSKDPDVEAINSTVGASGFISLPNNGRLFMRLKERSKRSRSVDQIIQELRPKLAKVAGIRCFLQNPPTIRLGGQITKAMYQYTISDTDIEQLYSTVPELEKKLRQFDSLQDVSSDLQIKNPQVTVEIDRDRASALGITASQIESALSYASSTRQVATFILSPSYAAHESRCVTSSGPRITTLRHNDNI